MNIIFTVKSFQDKNARLYYNAITKECANRNIDFKTHVATNQEMLDELLEQDQFLVLEPSDLKINLNHPNNLEHNITAKVCRKLCNEVCKKKVLVVSRSLLIGRPLVDMLLDDNFSVMIAHSKTDTITMQDFANMADIVVLATGNDMTYLDLTGKDVVDVSNDYKGKEEVCGSYKGMREIGRMTTNVLLDSVK